MQMMRLKKIINLEVFPIVTLSLMFPQTDFKRNISDGKFGKECTIPVADTELRVKGWGWGFGGRKGGSGGGENVSKRRVRDVWWGEGGLGEVKMYHYYEI